MKRKIALITGATAGIGKACAFKFAENNYDIIITGRRLKQLEEVAKEVKEKYKADVLALNFDVRKLSETTKAIESIDGKWKAIDVLVNNAGLAVGMNPINEGVIDDWERMIDTNIKGLLYITRLVSPLMVERKQGHIINIGSIAGKETYANGNVYCATKSAVDVLSKGIRIDLLKHNIKVTAIHPGAVETEFSIVRFKGDTNTAANVYKGFKPLTGMDVAETIYFTTTLPAHVNINEMLVLPTAQANTVHTYKSV
ncbi:MAG TPA: SDR family NAD(P)-dependent oxidoreductase [Bacteroidales bacterium]|nr:SDR family NAD(P)-dependent oxidoreductase [Bacteroidales bacterium]HPS17062.1 SDR family NAD(P)-dependent oxidoreductase [Bacteroidales bacterium]